MLARRLASQAVKKSVNGFLTLSAVTGSFLVVSSGTEGRIIRYTLSPVPLGLVWVPWKWMFPVLDPWKQSGNLSPILVGYPFVGSPGLLVSQPIPLVPAFSPWSMD